MPKNCVNLPKSMEACFHQWIKVNCELVFHIYDFFLAIVCLHFATIFFSGLCDTNLQFCLFFSELWYVNSWMVYISPLCGEKKVTIAKYKLSNKSQNCEFNTQHLCSFSATSNCFDNIYIYIYIYIYNIFQYGVTIEMYQIDLFSLI